LKSGKGGHLTVRLGAQVTSLPMHGARKEIGQGLEHHIKKVLTAATLPTIGLGIWPIRMTQPANSYQSMITL